MIDGSPLTPRHRITFATNEAYGASLSDARFWMPWVHDALRELGMPQRRPVVAGAAGTFPTMLVGEGDERIVVKFFGPLFHGPACAAIERELYALLSRDPAIPTPRLLATTTLDAGSAWPWEVIVSTVMPGESLTQARTRGVVSATDGKRIARFLATVTDRLAALTPGPHAIGVNALLADDWEIFLRNQARSCATRHRSWGDLSPHLIAQMDDWIDVNALLAEGMPLRALIHGDLTADHVFGIAGRDGWEPAGVIDFGDARIADRRYDLIPLFVDGFAGDRTMLRTYLDAIGTDLIGGNFPRSMLALTLLHEFRVLGKWFGTHPEAMELPTLDALALAMWDS
ncbi:MAG: aminoglycoside phosphotransferase family protein [Thermomicrobiales bacterium]